MNPRTELTVRFAGTAGEGVLTAGDILAGGLSQAGYHVFFSVEYDAEMRGERPCMSQVRVAAGPLLSQGDAPDILAAFSAEAVDAHAGEVNPGGLVIYDNKMIDAFGESSPYNADLVEGREGAGIPFLELAWKGAKRAESRNMVALGAVASVIGLSLEVVLEALEQRFGARGHAARANIEALALGSEAASRFSGRYRLVEGDGCKRHYISGNQAVVLGALAAGCGFFAGYPITPASEVMEGLAVELPKSAGVVMQMEDEMAALGAVLGASFGGVKAMTATSGPGFSLMSELINLGAMAELPAVIVNVQRGGPGTGLPTKPEQSDLNQAVYGVHGESPRIVLAAASIEDCFYKTIDAFNLAERCQTPVILLSDQFLGQSKATIESLDPHRHPIEGRLVAAADDLVDYRRYRRTESGVSPVAIPGMDGGFHIATGLEHGERGLPNYSPGVHRKMTEKRFKKLDLVTGDGFTMYGGPDASLMIIGWGAVVGVLCETAQRLAEQGRMAAVIEVSRFNPWPTRLAEVIGKREVVSLEMNFTGQLNALLRLHGINSVMIPWQGRLFSVRDLFDGLDRLQMPHQEKGGEI